MAINPGDMMFFGSVYPVDGNHGGGRMAGYTIQNGVENLLFPDITPDQRSLGGRQYRKLFAAVTADNSDMLSGGKIAIVGVPNDPNVSVSLIMGRGEDSTISSSSLDTVPGAFVTYSAGYGIESAAIYPSDVWIMDNAPVVGADGFIKIKIRESDALMWEVKPGVIVSGQYGASDVLPVAPRGFTATVSEVAPYETGWVLLSTVPAIQKINNSSNYYITGSVKLRYTVGATISSEAVRRPRLKLASAPVIGAALEAVLFHMNGDTVVRTPYKGYVTAVEAIDQQKYAITVNPAIGPAFIGFDAENPVLVKNRNIEITADNPRKLSVSASIVADAAIELGSRLSLSGTGGGAGISHLCDVTSLEGPTGGLYKIGVSSQFPSEWTMVHQIVVVKYGSYGTNGDRNRYGAASMTGASAAGADYVPLDRVLFESVPLFREGDDVVIYNTTSGASEVRRVKFVDFRGGLKFTAALNNAYPNGSVVGGIVSIGNLAPSAGIPFFQQTWTKVFSDTIAGNTVPVLYDHTASPFVVKSSGAINERWALIFTTLNTFKFIGEHEGQVATGSVLTDFSPINPKRNKPYITIPAAGWREGRGIGNVMRLNTTGAYGDVYAERHIRPGPGISSPRSVMFQLRGSVNA